MDTKQLLPISPWDLVPGLVVADSRNSTIGVVLAVQSRNVETDRVTYLILQTHHLDGYAELAPNGFVIQVVDKASNRLFIVGAVGAAATDIAEAATHRGAGKRLQLVEWAKQAIRKRLDVLDEDACTHPNRMYVTYGAPGVGGGEWCPECKTIITSNGRVLEPHEVV